MPIRSHTMTRQPPAQTNILDFAVVWFPIDGPPPDVVRTHFGIDMDEYRLRLRGSILTEQLIPADRPSERLARVYARPVLTALLSWSQANQQIAPDPAGETLDKGAQRPTESCP